MVGSRCVMDGASIGIFRAAASNYSLDEPLPITGKDQGDTAFLLPIMPMLESLSLEGLAAVAALIIALLGLLASGAFWASAMFSKVSMLVVVVEKLNDTLAMAQVNNDQRFKEMDGRIDGHDHRLTRVEVKNGL